MGTDRGSMSGQPLRRHSGTLAQAAGYEAHSKLLRVSAAQPPDEASVGRMEIENADGYAARAEAVLDVRGYGEECAGSDAVPVSVLEELKLALEHIEGVGVV